MVDLTSLLMIYTFIMLSDNKRIRGKWNFNFEKPLVYPLKVFLSVIRDWGIIWWIYIQTYQDNALYPHTGLKNDAEI